MTDLIPTPAPEKPWIGRMTWNDLLFMHWPVHESVLRHLVPAGLEIDRFDGQAWIGVIPFYMSDVRPRGVPSVLASEFPELNVRTYVRFRDQAGVWFFSLDAASRLAVWGARRFFHLPYHYATMSTSSDREIVAYRSRRAGAPEVRLVCQYMPKGPPVHFAPGTLEFFLAERYCLFTEDPRGDLLRGDIRHEPWPLQRAEVEMEINTMTSPIGLTLPRQDPLVHFAKQLDVLAWKLERADSSTSKEGKG